MRRRSPVAKARPRSRTIRQRPAGRAVLDFLGELTMGKVLTGIAALGLALTYMLGGWAWLSGQVVWAGQFNQVVGEFNCQFADIKRTQLEGQLADADFRISTYSAKKALSPDEARDLSNLKIYRDRKQRELTGLPDCSAPGRFPQQQPRR